MVCSARKTERWQSSSAPFAHTFIYSGPTEMKGISIMISNPDIKEEFLII